MAFDETIKHGTTSKVIEVILRDSSTGQGKTGLAHGDVTASYVREGSTRTAITLASGSAGDLYSSGKWAEVDATNMPGIYQLHVPNAAIASGVNAATLFLKATGIIDKAIRIGLIGVDLRDTDDLGLTSIDAILVDTGTTIPATLTTIAGYIDTEVAADQGDDLQGILYRPVSFFESTTATK